jgi:hypothetical protein
MRFGPRSYGAVWRAAKKPRRGDGALGASLGGQGCLGDDDAIDREFSAVCRAIWGFTLDDFTDDDLSAEDHAWLDELTQECAIEFAAEQGYDLRDYVHGGCVADWWGFAWMILAEARGVLTPEKRAADRSLAERGAPWVRRNAGPAGRSTIANRPRDDGTAA